MLTQETLVEIHVLHRQGESIRAIAQKLGVSRNTVRRYLRDLSAVPTYPDRTQRVTKLDPYKDYLLARIEAAKPHWIPATVLLREIQDRGYAGGISRLKSYIADLKTVESDPVVRFETPPGKQMPVDFTTISRHRRKIKAFVATLGFSRATYVRFSEHERQEDWLQGIEEACHYFGGVPQEILPDYVARNIIGNYQFRHSHEEFEGSDVGANPVRQLLAPGGFGVGVIGSAHNRHKDLRLVDLSGGAVNDGHGLAGVVHKQLLTRSMVLAHHQVQLALPGPVALAEPAVLIPLWVCLPVLLPEQEQSDVFTLQFIVNLLPVRYAPDLSRQVWGWRKQHLF
jgi:transposase